MAKQLSALVHDNESKLAPTLEKLNSVTAMLEKNRDNIAKALPGLAKFRDTMGEAISSMYAYSAFVPNFLIPQLFQPFLDYLWGFRTFDTARGPGFPSPVPRALVPGHITVFQRALAVRWADGSEDRNDFPDTARQTRGQPGSYWLGSSSPATALILRDTFFRPKTITAYFTTATAIYPGDEVRVSGVKVGRIKSIQPRVRRPR